MKKLRSPGPCPDPDRYILVRRRNGQFWRLKRGQLKPAPVNAVLAANAENTKQTMPAAGRILTKLAPYTENFARDRRMQRISRLFSEDINRTGEMTYRLFDRFEMQKKYRLFDIYIDNPVITVKKKVMEVTIDLAGESVRQRTSVVTHYYFELILLSGDPNKEKALRTESDCSELYNYGQEYKNKITLSLQLPDKKPYLVFLKCGCMEGKSPAANQKNYGMKVVGTGL